MISFYSIRTRVDGWSNKLCILQKGRFSIFSFLICCCCLKLVVVLFFTSFIQCCRSQCTVFCSAFSIQPNHFGRYFEIRIRLRCLSQKNLIQMSVWLLPDSVWCHIRKFIFTIDEWWKSINSTSSSSRRTTMHFFAYGILWFRLEMSIDIQRCLLALSFDMVLPWEKEVRSTT